MNYSYTTEGTCSKNIAFNIEEDRLYHVQFTGGCNGNLKAIAALIEGKKVDEVINQLEGITCGMRKTSCADQLTKALKKVKLQQINK